MTTPISEIRDQLRRENKVYHDEQGREYVYHTCHHCGGTGNYPSNMIPVGRCYLYCWQNRTPDTFGKHPKLLETVAKSIQRAEREAEKWEAGREKREAEAKCREAKRAEWKAAAEARKAKEAADKLASSAFVGKIGERIELTVTAERVMSFDGQFGRFYIVLMKTSEGHTVVYKGGSPPLREGETADVCVTVAEHDIYNGGRQTRVKRVSALRKAS